MSTPWISMAREQITSALSGSDLEVEAFSFVEEFTNPPAALRREGADTIGFTIRIGHGSVAVLDEPHRDADVRIVSDYGDALVVARAPSAIASDPAEVLRRVDEGRLIIIGDLSGIPEPLRQLDIHRLLARHTR